jgi:hypothetical protein
MHGKLTPILAMFVTVFGALSQAPALAAAPVVPAAPSGLAASPPGPAARSGLAASPPRSSVSLTWTNNATLPAATAMQIERATDDGFTRNVTTFAVDPNATSYTDTSVVVGATYRYRVRAQNLAGSSPWSNVVSIVRPGTSAPLSFFGPQFACGAYCAGSFGWTENTAVTTADNVPSSTSFAHMLRIIYPAGSIDSGSVTKLGTPLGGAQAAIPFAAGGTSATTTLRYYIRPQLGFQSIRGGKLPGLYGGNTSVASGGHDPDGTNGWTARLMWRNDNNGEVYAYLADTDGYGLQLGCGNWTWQPGKWTKVQETVHLNTPGKANGYITVYIDGVPALNAIGLMFRTVSSLQINGLYLSTFFGGSDKTWATPQTQYVDFAGFGVTSQPQSALPAAACKVIVGGSHSRRSRAAASASRR